MTNKFHFSILFIATLSSVFFSSCKDRCSYTRTTFEYEPVYISYDEVRQGVANEGPRALSKTGKIYMINNFILVNERNEGIHVIDNSNPSAPINVAFIRIPGNIDMAVKGGTLYADSYIDLLAFDFSNPAAPALVSRIENVLPQRQILGWSVNIDNSKGIVKEYRTITNTERVKDDCNQPSVMPMGDMRSTTGGLTGSGSGGSRAAGSGKAGSMARFAIVGNYLYVVDVQKLHVFSISSPYSPNELNVTDLGRGDIETIFPYRDKLFIGSQSGMHIYDISSPSSPSFVSTYIHVTTCDPVVVQGNYAYVTLRSGTACHSEINELQVVDISDMSNPTLTSNYSMYNPHGLGIDNNLLFICDDTEGLKVYDATDVMHIDQHMLKTYGNIQATDVIPNHDILLMVGSGGLYQYSYADPNNITLLSTIPIN